MEEMQMESGQGQPVQPTLIVSVAPKIVFAVPNKTTPGFLRRQIDTLKYAAAWRSVRDDDDESPESLLRLAEVWERTVDHLLNYVVEPANRDEARRVLMDATEEQIDYAFALIRGKGVEPPLAK